MVEVGEGRGGGHNRDRHETDMRREQRPKEEREGRGEKKERGRGEKGKKEGGRGKGEEGCAILGGKARASNTQHLRYL